MPCMLACFPVCPLCKNSVFKNVSFKDTADKEENYLDYSGHGGIDCPALDCFD